MRRKESDYLHQGDPVWWKPNWGLDKPRMAEVDEIQTNCDNWSHNGKPRESLIWARVDKPKTVVGLTNGHWAYGYQIHPVEIWRKVYD